ncbi:MAG: hypothetical protein RID91_06270 [Azospirillaceae bacterium]
MSRHDTTRLGAAVPAAGASLDAFRTYDRELERTATAVANNPHSTAEDRKRLARAIRKEADRIHALLMRSI